MSDMQPSDPLLTDPWRGLFGRCPRCSEGRMFRPFLKMSNRCDICGEQPSHHRADVFPAYIVILGHLVPAALFVEAGFAAGSRSKARIAHVIYCRWLA